MILLKIISLIILLSINAQAYAWGCKAAKIKTGKTTKGCIKVDNLKREYLLHVPKSYGNKPMPLVLGLHGGGGKAKRFEDYSSLSRTTNQFITVYPKGVNKHWNDGRPAINPNVNDVAFFNALIAHLDHDLKLIFNNTQVNVIGMSNGGLMALRLACEQPSWLKGVGIIAATMTEEIYSQCKLNNNLKPLKVVFVFGDKDTAFLANGKLVSPIKPSKIRGQHIGIQRSVDYWSKVNQCDNNVNLTTINTNNKDNTKVFKNSRSNCLQPVIFYNVKNGGHRWPNKNSKNGRFMVKRLNLGLASLDMNTGDELMKDLIDH